MSQLVFVYGTLRKGECNHHYMTRCRYLGLFTTSASFKMYDLGDYPALVSEGHSEIVGAVYSVDEHQLQLLDKLEGVPVEYTRERIATSYGEAWVYLYQGDTALSQPILSGDWCKRHKKES